VPQCRDSLDGVETGAPTRGALHSLLVLASAVRAFLPPLFDRLFRWEPHLIRGDKDALLQTSQGGAHLIATSALADDHATGGLLPCVPRDALPMAEFLTTIGWRLEAITLLAHPVYVRFRERASYRYSSV